MNEDKLQQLQDEMMKEIDKEVELENHINHASSTIAHELITKKRTRATIDNSMFSLIYHVFPDPKDEKVICICLIAVDELRFKISNGKYRPFKCEAVMDMEYSEEENLQMVVESFIRHKTGLIKPEEIENN